MGLLDLFQHGKTTLDIESPLSNGSPINVPANNFVQNYLPNKSYLDSTQGKPNNGSELATTFPDTNLDNTDSLSTDLTTQYTQYNTGEFGTAAETFTPKWSKDKPYISNYNPTSQTKTINETGLDVEAPNSVTTSPIPNTSTPYPELSRGEFGGSSNQFTQTYTPNSTYLSNINLNTQPQTLNETGLDVENPNAAPTTQLPNNYTPYPQYVQGEFNGATSQYVQTYTPSNPYMGYINSTEGNETNPQVNSLSSTGLDTEAEDVAPTATIPTTSLTEYPALTTGVWGFNADQFSQHYNQNDTYINNIYNGFQIFTLSKTSLDVELPEYYDSSTPVPDSISSPTLYPQLSKGIFGYGSNNFSQAWYPNNSYLDNYNDTILPNTLIDTGLDVEDVPMITGVEPISLIPTPNFLSSPTNYGIISPSTTEGFQIKMGILGGPAYNFSQNWFPALYYRFIDNLNYYFNIDTNPLVTKVTGDYSTGLDVENSNAAGTTFVNSSLTDPTIYPSLATGRWNHSAHSFGQDYTPSYTYLNNINDNEAQQYTLDNTGLDVEDPDHNSTVFVPDNTTDPTIYPVLVTGEWGGSPSIFTQPWNPTLQYYSNVDTDFLKNSGYISSLDVEYENEESFTPNPNDIGTDYFTPTYSPRGRYNTSPLQYIQQWSPSNYYYDLGNSDNWNKLQFELTSPSFVDFDDGGSGLDIENTDLHYLLPFWNDPLGKETYYPYVNSSHMHWGKFQGPPDQFTHPNRPNFNQYYNDGNYSELVNIDTNPQIISLVSSSLDVEALQYIETTVPPPWSEWTDPTVYPILTSGVWGGAANGFIQPYFPSLTYLSTYAPDVQIITLQYTKFDIEDLESLNPNSPNLSNDNVTVYPFIPTNQNLPPVNLGEFGFGPNRFYQYYTPNNSYLTSLDESIQVSSLYNSGLDIEDSSSSTFSPPIPDTITEYPSQPFVHLDGVVNEYYPKIDVNSNPTSQYAQRWKPTQTYYSYMKNGEFAPFAA